MRRRLDGRASRVFQVDLAPGVKVDLPAMHLATSHRLPTAKPEPGFSTLIRTWHDNRPNGPQCASRGVLRDIASSWPLPLLRAVRIRRPSQREARMQAAAAAMDNLRRSFDSGRHASHALSRKCRFNQRVNSHITQCSRQAHKERSLGRIAVTVSTIPVSRPIFPAATPPPHFLNSQPRSLEQQRWACATGAPDLDSQIED